MIILGIDPGTTRVGFGVIKKDGAKLALLKYGILKNSGEDKINLLLSISTEIETLLKKYHPDDSSVEKLFFFTNQKTTIDVSEARGVILLTLSKKGVPVCEFTPLQVKQAVSGYGRADKDQVQRMVKLILGLKENIRPDDAADALAIAICCANSYTPFK